MHHPITQVAVVTYDLATWTEIDAVEVKVQVNVDRCDPDALKLNHYDAEVWGREAVTPTQAREILGLHFQKHQTMELVSKAGRPYRTARIAGHNAASFDAPRLRAAWGDRFSPFCWWYPLDTLQLALWFFAQSKDQQPANFQLGTLCDHFGIQVEGAHDALADVRATAKLAQVLTELAPVL